MNLFTREITIAENTGELRAVAVRQMILVNLEAASNNYINETSP